MKRLKLIVCKTIFTVFSALLFFAGASCEVSAKNVVVMLDPGHGGENMGGQIPGFDEKNLTLVLANLVKQELEQFDGITVLMTRTDDSDLSLADRPRLAKEAGADFILSLHFNKAVPNRLYGAEVWIPSIGKNYSKGYAMGDLVLNELCDVNGLFRRGIKTKVKEDFSEHYGILRHAQELDVPSAIIEHCHIDNEKDLSYWSTPDALMRLAKADATAIAKYFRLSSKALALDYSAWPQTTVPAPSTPVVQDVTPPDSVSVSFLQKNGINSRFKITASDAQSPIMYYDYSTDGGVTWSDLKPFKDATGGQNSIVITIPGSYTKIYVRAYNMYDLFSEAS